MAEVVGNDSATPGLHDLYVRSGRSVPKEPVSDPTNVEHRALIARDRVALMVRPDEDERVMPAPSRPCNVLDGGAAHDPCADSARPAVVDQHLSPGAVMHGPLAAFMLTQPRNDRLDVKTERGRQA